MSNCYYYNDLYYYNDYWADNLGALVILNSDFQVLHSALLKNEIEWLIDLDGTPAIYDFFNDEYYDCFSRTPFTAPHTPVNIKLNSVYSSENIDEVLIRVQDKTFVTKFAKSTHFYIYPICNNSTLKLFVANRTRCISSNDEVVKTYCRVITFNHSSPIVTESPEVELATNIELNPILLKDGTLGVYQGDKILVLENSNFAGNELRTFLILQETEEFLILFKNYRVFKLFKENIGKLPDFLIEIPKTFIHFFEEKQEIFFIEKTTENTFNLFKFVNDSNLMPILQKIEDSELEKFRFSVKNIDEKWQNTLKNRIFQLENRLLVICEDDVFFVNILASSALEKSINSSISCPSTSSFPIISDELFYEGHPALSADLSSYSMMPSLVMNCIAYRYLMTYKHMERLYTPALADINVIDDPAIFKRHYFILGNIPCLGETYGIYPQ